MCTAENVVVAIEAANIFEAVLYAWQTFCIYPYINNLANGGMKPVIRSDLLWEFIIQICFNHFIVSYTFSDFNSCTCKFCIMHCACSTVHFVPHDFKLRNL